MNTYILFVYGNFEDREDIEFFCSDVFPSESILSVKYIIENNQNIIIIFDSYKEKLELAKELYSFLTPEFVKFYFLFEREKLVTAHIPESMKDFIFKPVENEEINIMKVDFYRPKKDETPSFTLDDILDKIEKMGVSSLTPEEKNFLDNFEN
jgi:hypothetical protein